MSDFEPLRRFFREHIATRPAAVGGAVALGLGVLAGSALGIGRGFEEPPPMQPVAKRPPEAAPAPIVPMVDASGKVPEWVIGTDNIPGRRRPVETASNEAPEAADEPRERRRWPTFLAPWRWGRGDDGRLDEPPPPRRYGRDREVDSYEYEEPPPPRTRERRSRYATEFEPPPEARRGPRGRYDEPAELDVYEDEPPPERWRYERR